MRRLVLSDAGGRVIAAMDVRDHELAEAVIECRRRMPGLGLYVDGALVPADARLHLAFDSESTAAAPKAPQAPVAVAANPAVDPERALSLMETLGRAFEDIRRAQVQTLSDLEGLSRRFGEMWIERERDFADEAARQRALTQKSLADVDLLGRSVKAAQLREVFAASGSGALAPVRPREQMRLVDLVNGFVRATMGGGQE